LNDEAIEPVAEGGFNIFPITLTSQQLNDKKSTLRIMAKDQSYDMEYIGSISFNVHRYFFELLDGAKEAENSNLVDDKASFWLTLSVDENDDKYDGVIGEDDEELTRVFCHF